MYLLYLEVSFLDMYMNYAKVAKIHNLLYRA